MASELDNQYTIPPMRLGEPAWVIASLFPVQGKWSEEDYFRLESNHFVELVDGCIEVLPMPTALHHLLVAWLYEQLIAWNKIAEAGNVLFAPLPLRLFAGTIREPDILLIPRSGLAGAEEYPSGALVVMEVISKGADARNRDVVEKRRDYAKSGIPEYWIVDPFEKSVTVLQLAGADFAVHGEFGKEDVATSPTLPGFAISCAELWAQEKRL